jgi:hypothetical protein
MNFLFHYFIPKGHSKEELLSDTEFIKKQTAP